MQPQDLLRLAEKHLEWLKQDSQQLGKSKLKRILIKEAFAQNLIYTPIPLME